MAVLSLTEDELRELVTPETAAHVLFVLDGEGRQPGSFTTKLILAAASADSLNLMKLGGAFPEIAAAVDSYGRADFGRDVLREIMNTGL
jgi:hypothetical protein